MAPLAFSNLHGQQGTSTAADPRAQRAAVEQRVDAGIFISARIKKRMRGVVAVGIMRSERR